MVGAVDVEVRPSGDFHEALGLGFVGGAHGSERVEIDFALAPFHRVKASAPGFGQAWFIEKNRTHRRASAGVDHRGDHFVGEVFVAGRITHLGAKRIETEAIIPATTVVGIVAGEKFQSWTDGDGQDIAGAFDGQFHA